MLKKFIVYLIGSRRLPAIVSGASLLRPFSYLGLLSIFYLLACNAPASSEAGVRIQPFFDLKGYFDQQIEQLNADQPALTKHVHIGDQEEEKTVDGIDFSQELQIFSRSDINRPAWSDKYQIDSTVQAGALMALSYTAIDTSLVTRLLEIEFAAGTVSSIHIVNRSQSAIANTDQDLQYHPGERYQIISTQKTIGSSPKTVRIEASFSESGS